MKTIRFNQWINGGVVRLALEDGQQISHYTFERTDEGWCSELNTWWREGDTIYCQRDEDGRDCDGRMSHCNVWSSSGADLTANVQPEAAYPHWTRAHAHQRDYAAEAMGY